MKKILVPIDFSPCSLQALDYAVGLARDLGSSLHLLHTYVVHSSADMIISIERYIREDAEKMMEESKRRIDKQWPHHPPVTHAIIKGNAIPVIAAVADQYDLVVMGTQGASRLKGIFLGSTTNGVCKATETPVLAIPENARYRPLQKIVLAVDDYEVTGRKVLEPLIELSGLNDAEIKIFHAELGKSDLGVDPVIGMYLSDREHSFHYGSTVRKINDRINDFVEEADADLLCLIGRKRAWINELLHRSVTKREVFQTELPLLVLTDVAIITDY